MVRVTLLLGIVLLQHTQHTHNGKVTVTNINRVLTWMVQIYNMHLFGCFIVYSYNKITHIGKIYQPNIIFSARITRGRGVIMYDIASYLLPYVYATYKAFITFQEKLYLPDRILIQDI